MQKIGSNILKCSCGSQFFLKKLMNQSFSGIIWSILREQLWSREQRLGTPGVENVTAMSNTIFELEEQLLIKIEEKLS